MQDVLANSMVE